MPLGPGWAMTGSSPLARGLHDARVPHVAHPGIIPARAGFTMVSPSPLTRPSDHPRSRGVYASTFPSRRTCSGSSPLARGLRSLGEFVVAGDGIIPARAGFTGRSLRRGGVTTDHPRSRGVYQEPREADQFPAGSSPLARGLLITNQTRQPEAGIIPARAGFTYRSWLTSMNDEDHPRSRGVYSLPLRLSLVSMGSSPLARGLPFFYFIQSVEYGIIPARAGFTS